MSEQTQFSKYLAIAKSDKVKFDAMRAESERFIVLKKWDGVVLESDDDSFTVRLIDGDGKLPTYQAIFARSQLSTEEQSQIAVGASFVWTIGYHHAGTTDRHDSKFEFNRLPDWSDKEINAGFDEMRKAVEDAPDTRNGTAWRDDLLTVPEQLSPRLQWMKEHGVTTLHQDWLNFQPWSAFIGPIETMTVAAEEFGELRFADNEHDAIVNLAEANGWPLWNEK